MGRFLMMIASGFTSFVVLGSFTMFFLDWWGPEINPVLLIKIFFVIVIIVILMAVFEHILGLPFIIENLLIDVTGRIIITFCVVLLAGFFILDMLPINFLNILIVSILMLLSVFMTYIILYSSVTQYTTLINKRIQSGRRRKNR